MRQPVFADQPEVSLVRQQVIVGLRDAILDMRLLPGERLIERELVEWSGVSRATVREALRELAAESLVEIIPRRGAIVSSPSVREAREIYDIRAILEGSACRQCSDNATAAQLKVLRRAFEGFKRSADTGSVPAMLKAKARIYDAIFAGAGNTTIKQLLSQLQARVTSLRALSMSQDGRIESTLAEISAIVEAIEARDSSGAELASIEHVRSAGEVAIEALARRHAELELPAIHARDR
jgi:DNA-binding GntR family transcriptional regulator